MKKLLAVLAAAVLVIWGMDVPTVHAQPRPAAKTYVVCSINQDTYSTALVQELKTSSPVTMTVPAMGAEGTSYYAVYQLSAPASCATLLQEAETSGPYPPGVNIEANTSQKPVLK